MSMKDLYESPSIKQNKGFIATLVKVAFADNQITTEESDLLKRISSKMSISEAELFSIINNPINYYNGTPYSTRERFEWLYDFVRMIEVDNVIDQKELKLLSKFSMELRFDDQPEMIKKVMEFVDQGKTVDQAYEILFP